MSPFLSVYLLEEGEGAEVGAPHRSQAEQGEEAEHQSSWAGTVLHRSQLHCKDDFKII